MSPALFKFAEGVHEAGVHERAEPIAFLDGETVIAHIGFGIREINFRVRHIEVAAENDGLFLFQFFQVGEKIFVPHLAIR